MTPEEQLDLEIGQSLAGAERSQMFGKPFICLFERCMVFKLTGRDHEAAIGLRVAILFDPSGRGRAMEEWVQVSTMGYVGEGKKKLERTKYDCSKNSQ